jgi:hypothetical protein
MAVSLVCALVIYPWYLVRLLPFVGSGPTLLLIVSSVSVLSTYIVYIVWRLHALGHAWQVPFWITLVEYGPVATAAGFTLLRRSARLAVPFAEAD